MTASPPKSPPAAATTSLDATAQTLNRIKRSFARAETGVKLLRAAALGLMATTTWALVRPGDEAAQLALGFVAFAVAVVSSLSRRKARPITPEDVALALEIDHGAHVRMAIDSSQPAAPLPTPWGVAARSEIRSLRRGELGRLLALSTSVLLPLVVSLATLPLAAPSFKLALSEVQHVVSLLSRGATIRVLSGEATGGDGKAVSLDAAKPRTIELLASNLLEVDVTGSFGRTSPVVELRKPRDKGQQVGVVFQSFQMMPARDGDAPRDDGSASETSKYTIQFAASEAVELFIPALSTQMLASLKVRELPVPKVKLMPLTELEDPWPDDQPLTLQIEVSAENAIDSVRLLIKSGSRVSKELVANVMADDRHELTTEYKLTLESYVESDLAQVEIVAEATDHAVPTPLVGHSSVLRLNTASAYGRYRQALDTLKELKEMVDATITEGKSDKLPPEARTLAAKAVTQSERSPFFDGLDRVQIHRFAGRVDETEADPSGERLLELAQALNDFLFEHEILDDRERDRDFFVSVRGLSRVVEEERDKRPVAVRTVTERIRKFLDDRQMRWEKRVERLSANFRPPKWEEIHKKKPFHGAMDDTDRFDDQAAHHREAKSQALTTLSKAVVTYRAWIEELEAAEDKMREEEERQRQEGLASARDTLRELQRRQGEISGELDRADERPKAELESQWPTTHMKQNTNEREAHKLEGQMRSLSPNAAARMQGAVKAMAEVVSAGESQNFQLSETAADLAGRLLRQAESSAQQSQQKRRTRGRRRRVTGDNYYGQSVVGGDIEIKREYQVDRRYREDILDEVQNSTYDEENRALLESYLRAVIR